MKKSVQKLSLQKKAISKLTIVVYGGLQKDTAEYTNMSGCCTTHEPLTMGCNR